VIALQRGHRLSSVSFTSDTSDMMVKSCADAAASWPMNDRDTIDEILLLLWTGYAVICLYGMNSQLGAWLAPQVSAALERLQARIRRRRDVTVALVGQSMTATAGTLTASVAPPDPPMSQPGDPPMSPPPGVMTPWRRHKKVVRKKKRRLRREAAGLSLPSAPTSLVLN
jgi:hypothetical protein